MLEAPLRPPIEVARRALLAVLLGVALLPPGAAQAAIEITSPTSPVRLAEGESFAAWRMGNRWDGDCPDWTGDPGDPIDPLRDGRFTCDVVVHRSSDVGDPSFAGGVFSGVADSANPWFWLTYPGRSSTFKKMSSGNRYPIDTGIYRYFATKVRFTGTANKQAFNLNFFEDDESGAFGTVRIVLPKLEPGVWQVVRLDLWDPATFGDHSVHWLDFPRVRGLRVNPVQEAGVTFEFDWWRLSAEGDPETRVTVEWSGGQAGETVAVGAVDGDGAEVVLASALPAPDGVATVDLAPVPPGTYDLRLVSSSGDQDVVPGVLAVNEAPLVFLSSPDERGAEELAYSLVEACPAEGDCYDWSSFDPEDIFFADSEDSEILPEGGHPPTLLKTFEQCSQLDFCPDPACVSDPRLYLMTCLERNPEDPTKENCVPDRFALIDTDRYRYFSYEMEISGERDCGSIARVLWGNDLLDLTVSDDIDVLDGRSTYVVGDLDDLPLASSTDDQETGGWKGELKFFRFDPHELWDERISELHSFVLAPADQTDENGLFEVRWIDSDGDDAAVLDLFYDLDEVPGNGNEEPIALGLSEAGTGGSYLWDTVEPTRVPPGEHRIYARIADGLNSTVRYALGPLWVPCDPAFGDPDSVVFSGVVADHQVAVACGEVRAVSGTEVTDTGSLVLRAGDRVVIEDGFAVRGSLVVDVDDLL